MEKILLAIDATQLNVRTLDFACYIARLTHSKLTGVFLENMLESELPARKQVYGISYVETIVAGEVPGNREKRALCEENIHLFKEACCNRNVGCNVHRNRNMPLKEIIEESRFADLLIIDAKTSFERHNEAAPTGFVRDILAAAECPVIVSPEGFDGINEVIFTYDGSASSVFAIKQFTYLFPALSEKKITVLQVNDHNDWTVDEKIRIGEWLKPHYSVIGFQVLHGKPKDELFGYLVGKKDAVVVMGAFGRNIVSRLFKSSNAELIVKAVNLPVFITHH